MSAIGAKRTKLNFGLNGLSANDPERTFGVPAGDQEKFSISDLFL